MSSLSSVATGSLTAAEQAVTLTRASRTSYAIQVTGTFVGTVTFEGSVDGTTYAAIPATKSDGTFVSTATAPGLFRIIDAGAVPYVRVRCSAYTSGTVTVKVVGERTPRAV